MVIVFLGRFVFKGSQLCIPDASMRKAYSIIYSGRLAGHKGVFNTLVVLYEPYFWSERSFVD